MAACPNCGAPLPVVAPGEVERCPFCAVETREPAPPPPPAPPPAPEPLPATTAIPPGLALAITVGALLLVTGLVVAVVHDCSRPPPPGITINIPPFPSIPSSPASPPRPTPASTRGGAGTTSLSLADLVGGSFHDSRPLDAPPIAGSADNFDAVKNVDWATALATTWSPDAKLLRIETSRVAKDGTLDVSRPFRGGMTESAVTYVFVAPGKAQDLELELNASWVHPAAAATAPFVTVRTTASNALPTERPVAKPACSLRQAFASLARSGVLVPSQAYQADLRDNGVGPWWVVSFAVVSATGGVKGVEGVVSAATCAIVHP